MAQLSAYEQYLLELVNRARLDPAAEAQRYGVDLGSVSTASRQPLAGNDLLALAAERHSRWMLDTGTFSHTGAGGSTPTARMAAAGYAFTGSWSSGENIGWTGTTGALNLLSAVDTQHAGLFRSSGHRANILNDGFREIGVGIETGTFSGYNAAMTTETFARSGTLPFLTGVAYIDRDANRFYTPGEGLGGIVFEARAQAGGASASDTTEAAGGYEMQLAAGTYDVSIRGGALTQALGVTLAMAARNVKLDLVGLDAIAASASVTLGANVKSVALLGTEALQATGNAMANVIVGNKGDNVLNGGAGADTLTGGAGNDTFVLRAGEVAGDRILDFTGNGAAAGDVLRFEGYGAGAKLTALGDGQWQVSDGTRTETFSVTGAIDAADYSFAGSGGGTGTPPPPPPPSPPPVSSADPVTGTANNDWLVGTGGADTLGGGAGNDWIYGQGGNDTLYGGAGNDYLSGGSGNDVLVGGAGADRFVIRAAAEAGDTISGFVRGEGDRLDLVQLFGAIGYEGADPFADGVLRTVQSGSSVRVDFDADGGGNGYVPLATLTNATVGGLGQDFVVWA